MSWHWWIIVTVVLMIAEVFTAGFFLACFAVGALLSAVASYFVAGTVLQVLLFSLGSLLAFWLIRPAMLRHFPSDPGVRTNVDALAGRHARVVEEINSISGKGRVAIDGDNWKAVCTNCPVIELGEAVEIVKVDGAQLFVKKIGKGS